MLLKEKIISLKGLEGYVADGFQELHEELGAAEAFDLEFDPCNIGPYTEDCHNIHIYLDGRIIGHLKYETIGHTYRIIEASYHE